MTTIIVPAYNEGSHIERLLSSLGGYKVIVVDDGSTDNTAEIAGKNAHVVVLKKNSGKGTACMTGLRKSKTENCVFIDGDGQLYVRDIPKIVKALEKADIVIGERSRKEIPALRRISNAFARFCVNRITGQDFGDVLCGLRGVRKSAFSKLRMRKLGYYFESEMLLEAAKKNLRIVRVPVSVSYKTGSRMPLSKSLSVAVWLFGKVLKKWLGFRV